MGQQPVPLGASAYAVVGNRFVVQGGAILNDVLNQQFWALDLSSSWPTTSPAWKQLPNGPYNGYHTAIAPRDNKTFITFGRDTGAVPSMIPQWWVNIFDFTTNTWSGVNPASVQDRSRRDFAAVYNPNQNVAYVVGGDAGVMGDQQSDMFDVYDVAKKEVTETPIPANGPRGPYTYGAAWLQNHNSMLLVGGQTAPNGYPSTAFRYDAGKGTWSNQPTTGGFAFNRISPCVASSPDGTKFVAYGGYINGSPGGVADPAVYVLDTTTWVWTKYPQFGRGRGNAACALIDNMFIIWGGYFTLEHNKPEATPTDNEALIIMDIRNGEWLATYTPPEWLKSYNPGGQSPPPTTPSTPPPDGGGKLSTGAIIGIACGAAALLAALLLLLVFLRRRAKDKTKNGIPNGKGSNFEKDGNDPTAPVFDPRYSREEAMAVLHPPTSPSSQPYSSSLSSLYGQNSPGTPLSLPERPFDERPSSLPTSQQGYYFAGEPRHSLASTLGRPPSSTVTFNPSATGYDSYALSSGTLPRPISNQRLSTLSGNTAVPEPPPMLSHQSSTSASGSVTLTSPMLVHEMSPEGEYIKPPPLMSPPASDSWPMMNSSGLVSTESGTLYKNPQLYPEKDSNAAGTVPTPTSGAYDYGMQTYAMPGMVPSVLSPTMSSVSSSAASSTPMQPMSISSGPLPHRSSYTGPSQYHDEGVHGAAAKLPLISMVNDPAQIQSGQILQNPQLYSDNRIMAATKDVDPVGEPRRISNPQGNNGYGSEVV
ncbi:hypothetical protein BGW42_007014 [Actinomortierella wolfii]|nr:hypothetical protein BGW42_007014 [Actinomortierella wolfii]